MLFFIQGWDCSHSDYGGCTEAGDEFSYFTVLTYWGLAFYLAVAAVHTATYAATGRPLLDRFPRPLQALHALFYTTITVFPFIVTIVYWGRLYSGHWFAREFDAWSNISQHALNSAFALFEVVVPRTPRPLWIHLLWLIVILALYLGLAYITRASKGFYVYNFLDPATSGSGAVAAYVFGIAAACIIIYLLAHGLIALRKWITEDKLGLDGKFAHGGSSRSRRGDAEMASGAGRKEGHLAPEQ